MASAFGHALTAVALGTGFKKKFENWRFWTIGIICSILPDVDVVGYSLGVPYQSFWGHRGFSHSLLFAFIIGVLVSLLFYWKQPKISKLVLAIYFTLCTASHSILDAMTNGGIGLAFFSPWNNSRYFFPWRPIKVSPIGIDNFISDWGLQVIISEIIWIGTPSLVVILFSLIIKKYTNKKRRFQP
jgi:inner membrane protein